MKAIIDRVTEIANELVKKFPQVLCEYYLDQISKLHILYIEPRFIDTPSFIDFVADKQLEFINDFPQYLLCIGIDEKPDKNDFILSRQGYLYGLDVLLPSGLTWMTANNNKASLNESSNNNVYLNADLINHPFHSNIILNELVGPRTLSPNWSLSTAIILNYSFNEDDEDSGQNQNLPLAA